jgi:hypothetical protein
MSSVEESSGGRKTPGVVHFVPDADNRRGAITCISVGSQDGGKCKALIVIFFVYTLRSRCYLFERAPIRQITSWSTENHIINSLTFDRCIIIVN